MGWDFGWATRKELVAYLVKPWHSETVTCSTVEHESEGRDILWAVKEINGERRIACYLTEQNKHGWGYKAMDESMHPYYYNCPMRFLNLAPVACQEWRDKVCAA